MPVLLSKVKDPRRNGTQYTATDRKLLKAYLTGIRIVVSEIYNRYTIEVVMT
jgi:hypothetical protein